MKFLNIFILLIFLNSCEIYSQEKYVEKYPNGNLKVEGFLVGKTLDSVYKEYYENGNIKTEGFYKNGKRHGMFIEYDKYGKVLKKIKYTNGQIEK